MWVMRNGVLAYIAGHKWTWLALGGVTLAVLVGVSGWRLAPPEEKVYSERKDRLLKKTDLDALRDACRYLIKNSYGRPYGQVFDAKSNFTPPVLRRLEPTKVLVGETFVRVELGGPGLYYGFEVFVDWFNQAPYPLAEQVSDGIWYYETTSAIERQPR
jgi:hypothetical protein